MQKGNSIFWAALVTAFFIVVNAILTAKEFYFFNFLPVILIIIGLAFLRLNTLFLIVVFFVPLSIQLDELVKDLPFNLSLPTEPLIIGMMFLFFLKIIHEKDFDRRIAVHPVSLAIYFSLFWMFITSLTSSLPIISIKYFLMRTWFVVVFFFIATQVFVFKRNIPRFFWAYIIAFLIVIGYTVFRHAGHGFTQITSHFVMKPFYNDHTSYGAILAMFIPILFGLAILNKRKSVLIAIAIWGCIAIFFGALILSYTRAAWLSVVVAFVVMIIILLRIRFVTLFVFISVLSVLFFSYHTEITQRLEENRTPSSKDFADHIKSISNIRNDASNLERLNRWNSALRMFHEKPFLGFGPGTYQFKYAAYQLSYKKTRISTNFGTLGNAHSEYLGPLAEAGVLGTVSVLAIIITVIISAVRVLSNARDRNIRILALISLLGLITYWIHGTLNNFLDTDKASAPYWGFIAIIVALDVYHVDFKKAGENQIAGSKTGPVDNRLTSLK